MSVSTLFLDAGGVLVHPNWMRAHEVLTQIDVAVDIERLRAGDLKAKREMDVAKVIGATDDDARGAMYFQIVLTKAGVSEADLERATQQLYEEHAVRNLWDFVPDEVPVALERVRRSGVKMVVVSNANGSVPALIERLGLSRFFAAVVDSHDVGVEKPDPRIFYAALERCGGNAASTLHVGDFFHIDVVGAHAAGLRAVLLDAGDLYGDHDCPRVASLSAVADLLGCP